MHLLATGTKEKDGPYTTDHILLNGKEILSNIEEGLNKKKEPRLNREQRRRAEKGKIWCRDCGINWLRRFDEWSNCTVWPKGKGHDFNL